MQKDAELLATEHEVQVIHLCTPALLSSEDAIDDSQARVPVTRIPMSTKNPLHLLRAGRRLKRILANSEADVLHTQAFSTLLPLAGRRINLPWIHTEHWSALSNPKSIPVFLRPAVAAASRLLRRPDVVSAVCDYLAHPVRRYRKGPVRVVPCIVEPSVRLVPAPRDDDAPHLVAVGGLIDRKDPLCAIEALAQLRSNGFAATLTWVGDGPLRAAAQELAAERGISDALNITGIVDAEAVRQHLRDADIFVLPTLAENFCVSAAEALVEGRPVVVGSNGGQRDYVVPESGRIIEDQRPSQYAEAIRELWDATTATSAEQIAATIGDRFSSRAVLDGYDDAYRTAIEAHS